MKKNTKQSKNYFSIPELAEKLGISRIAVYKKVKKGLIPANRVGRNFIIKREDILELLGEGLSEKTKKEIDLAVQKVVDEYGETLRLLAKE